MRMLEPLNRWRERLPVQPSVLLVIGTAAGLFLLFGKIAEDVFSNESRAFDTAVI